MAEVVIDASAVVDLLLRNEVGDAVQRRVSGDVLHAPAHLDAEVLSAAGRLHRDGAVSADEVAVMLHQLVVAPIRRHPVAGLLLGSWRRRDRLRLAEALYVELALSLSLPLVTTDRRLGPVSVVEVVSL